MSLNKEQVCTIHTLYYRLLKIVHLIKCLVLAFHCAALLDWGCSLKEKGAYLDYDTQLCGCLPYSEWNASFVASWTASPGAKKLLVCRNALLHDTECFYIKKSGWEIPKTHLAADSTPKVDLVLEGREIIRNIKQYKLLLRFFLILFSVSHHCKSDLFSGFWQDCNW